MRAEIPKVMMASLFALVQPVSANATVIYSTFGVLNSYNCCSGYGVDGSSSSGGNHVSVAAGFTSSGDYTLGQIDVGLSYLSGTNSADVSVWTDVGGLPSLKLGSWSVSGQPDFGTASFTVATVSGITGVSLLSGDSYFVVVDAGAADTKDIWNNNFNPGRTGPIAFSSDSDVTWIGGDSVLPAFDLLSSTSTGVPEPGTVILFAAGLFGLGAIRRRKPKP